MSRAFLGSGNDSYVSVDTYKFGGTINMTIVIHNGHETIDLYFNDDRKSKAELAKLIKHLEKAYASLNQG